MPHNKKWKGDEGEIQPVILLRENAQGEYEAVTNPAQGSGGGGGVASAVDITGFDNTLVDADGGLKVHVQNQSAGGGGGTSGPVSIQDGVDPLKLLSVDNEGRLGINNFPSTQSITGSVAVSNFPATQPVSGTVTVSNPTANPETGLAKEATLESLRADIANGISAAISNFPATQPVSGTVAVSNFPATQPVSGTVTVSNPTANPETGLAKDVTAQAIRDRIPAALDADGGLKVHVQNQSGGSSGGLTNTELRATPVPVSGFPAVQPVSDNGGSLTVDGAVSVSNFPATQPVSGSVSVSNFPATQPVSGTVGVSGVVDVTPAAPAANDYLPVRLTDGSAFYSATGGGGGGTTWIATFTAETPYIATAAAAATKEYIALMNPASSLKIIRVREIWTAAGNAAPPAALGILEWYARRITAVVGGTAVNIAKNDTNDPATVATLVHSPTSVTNALTSNLWTSRWLSAIGTANILGHLGGQVIRLGETGSGVKPLVLRAGEGVGISAFTRVVHAPNVIIGIEWTEE